MKLNEIVNVLTTEIMVKFHYVKIGYEVKNHLDRFDLVVHVLDDSDMTQLTAFCKELESRQIDPAIPFTIAVNRRTTPWPGGMTDQELRERREKFLQMRKASVLSASCVTPAR